MKPSWSSVMMAACFLLQPHEGVSLKYLPTPAMPTVCQMVTPSTSNNYQALRYTNGVLSFGPVGSDSLIIHQTWLITPSSEVCQCSNTGRVCQYTTLKTFGAGSQTDNIYIARLQAIVTEFGNKVEDSMLSPNSELRVWCPRRGGTSTSGDAEVTPISLYFPSASSGKGFTVLTVANDRTHLILTQQQDKPASTSSGILLFLLPYSREIIDACVRGYYTGTTSDTTLGRRRRRQTSLPKGRPVRLTLQVGTVRYLVSRQSNVTGGFNDILIATPFCLDCLTPDSIFYYKGYITSHVDLSGQLLNGTSFTLQHGATGQYLTADVLQDTYLNVGSRSAGLKFQNENEFDAADDENFPDYRHFMVYRTEITGGALLNICPLFHKSYCILPAIGGALQLVNVNASNQVPRPALQDPSSINLVAFSRFAAALSNSSTLPFFGIFERSPVFSLGSPEQVSIAVLYEARVDFYVYQYLTFNTSLRELVFTGAVEANTSSYRILMQRWREPNSSLTYVSLQLTNDSSLASGNGYPRRYITRRSVYPVYYDSSAAVFGTADSDERLFATECCFCASNISTVNWIYWKSSASTVLSLSATADLKLTWKADVLPSNPKCTDYAFTVRSSVVQETPP